MKTKVPKQKVKRVFKPKLTPRRKPVGQFFRRYEGGIFDGRTEAVPMFSREPALKTQIDKPHWDGPNRKESNIYKLAEPTHKPKKDETYIYQAQA